MMHYSRGLQPPQRLVVERVTAVGVDPLQHVQRRQDIRAPRRAHTPRAVAARVAIDVVVARTAHRRDRRPRRLPVGAR